MKARIRCHIWFIFALMTMLDICDCYRPCSVFPDPLYTGRLLDCSNTGISSDDIATLDFINISTLIITNNNIQTLQNNSFSKFRTLKRLECSSCNLNVLEVDALDGLVHLQVVLLNKNNLRLNKYAFPFGFFIHVPRLKVLNIGSNQNEGNAYNYSKYIDLFDSLHELSRLEIDSFSNLSIGYEFSKLRNLDSLNITCENLVTLSNDSLQGFNYSTVKHFSLLRGDRTVYEYEDCDMLFQHLPNVSSLTIAHMTFGNMKLMKMLRPLQYKRFDLLYFDSVGIEITGHGKDDLVHDRIISADMVQYLKHVRVSNFVWLRNYALSIDLGALVSHEWKQCLKTFTFVTDSTGVYVDSTYLAYLFRLKNIDRFVYKVHVDEKCVDFWRDNEKTPQISTSTHNLTKNSYAFVNEHDKERVESTIIKNDTLFSTPNNLFHRVHGTYILKRFPPFLTNLVLDDIHSFSTADRVWFKNKNNLRSLSLRDAQYSSTFEHAILGWSHLEMIDFTGSELKGNPFFFKHFPSLKKMIMRNTNKNPDFFAKVAESIPLLEYFDIAENSLLWLPSTMFHSNRHLKYLCIASNRFARIPFKLAFTPNLEILDLRENSLILTHMDRQATDDHSHNLAGNVTFYILLDDNKFSCACSELMLLKWLQNSEIHFDKSRDYACMTNEGSLSRTSKFTDIRSFWRQCFGQSYFFISLALISTLVASYLATFLVIMHKTRIVSKIMQIMMPGFRLKARRDFSWDVVIGYADQDADFIRVVLLPYLEGRWRLRTFVHQRDLLQDPLLMSYAIKNSWRSLLIITENFLDRCHMAHNIMKVCSFFVNTTNPKSVIVIVEEKIQTRIPDYVLQVVDEDNIIVLPTLPQTRLNYEAKETLKTRILY